MKRSEIIESVVYHCLSWDGLDTSGVPREEIAKDILNHLEKLGMKLVNLEGEEEPFEPEEGWDTYFEERDRKERLRDFKVILDITRGSKIAQQFLDGKEFEELAEEHNVTRERIRQIVCKYRRKYQQGPDET